MKKYIGKKFSCEILVGDCKTFGEITFNGLNTIVEVWSSEPIIIDNVNDNIYGLIYEEMEHISLIDSIYFSQNGVSTVRQGDKYVSRYRSVIHPRIVVIGTEWFENTASIEKVWFSTDKLEKIFYDHHAFRSMINVDESVVNDLVQKDLEVSKELFGYKANINDHTVEKNHDMGAPPSIYIYTGSKEILSFKTSFGNFSLYHTEGQSSYGGSGVKSDISTKFCISLNESINVRNIVNECWKVLGFIKVLSGKEDYLSEISIKTKGDDKDGYFDIYVSTDYEEKSDEYFDSLLNMKMGKDYLSKIFQAWFDSYENKKDARNQLCLTYSSNKYNVDRVVRCANVFDLILDKSKVDLPNDIKEAKAQARKFFKALPDSLERQSILQALGRLGTKTLKHKINERIEIIRVHSDFAFDELKFIAHQAVDCRNFFVHGGNKKFDYESHFNMVNFFIDTLEFIFVVSDLLECGWKFDAWRKPYIPNHKVGIYLDSYSNKLTQLQTITSK
ncbi:HEPN domain-containing protein [Shewanella woodyi]|uniref:HEPN domain-containing protein n=1 Tax=Shewanella woodyi TaxID=60961 RepID=UPI0007F95D7D|nr:HEPN domain-containing protein [Shewanella woodyi]